MPPPLRLLLRSAGFRLAALYVAVFAVSAGILGGGVFLAARAALEQQMTARIDAETAYLREEYRAGGLDKLRAVVQTRGRGASALGYLLMAPDGTRLAGEMVAVMPLRAGWLTVETPHGVEDDGRAEVVRALVTDLGGELLLAVGDDLGRMGEVEEAIGTAFLWTVGLAALLGVGGGILVSRNFLRRVEAISRTAEAIIGGDLGQRVPVRGTGDDLDRLAVTLNHMLDRISALMDSLRQVSSDVAHDLRTPLSRLYQRLEDAQLHAGTVADYDRAVVAAMREAEGLLEIFSALLRIAQVEGASPRAGFGVVALSGVVEAVADAYRPDAEEAGHRLDAEIADDIRVCGDRELLTQAVANLVENTLRHTPAGTRIMVRLRREDADGVWLIVEDDGPGVAPGDLSRLTQRFYRSERSRTTPGSGLGLSLVAAVAELHGIRLEFADARPGLRISLWFDVLAG